MKIERFLGLLLNLTILFGCSDLLENEQYGQKLAQKVYGARIEGIKAPTKAERIFGNDILWTAGDPVTYYLYNGSFTSTYPTSASVGGTETQLTVSYDKTRSDTKIYAVFKGTGLGEISDPGATVTVANGIPKTQDGTFEKYMFSKAVEDFNVQSLAFKPEQAFIKFSIISKGIKKSDSDSLKFSKIVISDNNPTAASRLDIAGNVTYPMSATGSADKVSIASEGSKTISCDILSGDDAQYYVAILPGTYANGLRFSFQDASGNELAYVVSKSNIEIKRGKITEFGILDFHNVVVGTKADIFPKKARIIYNSDAAMNMSKKFWLEFEPVDASGVTWSYNTSHCELEDTGIEIIGGKHYFTCVVTPKSKCGVTTITGTLLGDRTPPSSSATLVVGDFVDLGGGNVIWAGTLLAGDSKTDGLSLEANPIDCSGMYLWGDQKVKNRKKQGAWLTTGTDIAVWTWGGNTGDWAGTKGANYKYGGRYNGQSGAPYGTTTTLRAEDDAASLCNTNWHMPDRKDYEDLESICTWSYVQVKGVPCFKFVSKKDWFKDVYILRPVAGAMMSSGQFGREPVSSSEWSRNIDQVINATTGAVTATRWNRAWAHLVNNIAQPSLLPGQTGDTRNSYAMPIRPVADRTVADANGF